jgi:long-chain acyl-CoA synthetase
MVHRKLGGHLRLIASGGAALPVEIHRLWERLGVRIAQGYGTSECSPVIASAAADGSTPTGSVGRPIRGVQVRLSPDGELLVRGPNVMRGYWKDPERTAGTFNDGWFATGDIATIDKDGYIWLQGRAKDLIALPSGMKVWPEDVEAVLCAHPAIKDAAVIPVPLPGGGAKLHAYLIAAPGWREMADLTAIIAQSNGRLALHQRVSTASWWEGDDFPRTSTMKVRRNLLPQPEHAASVTVQSVLAADDPVAQAVCGVARVSSVAPEQTLGQLGLDSLSLVELALVLEEKTGKSIGDGDLRPDMTVDGVRAFLAAAPEAGPATYRQEGGAKGYSGETPLWPYGWGRLLRFIGAPSDLVYRALVPHTIVLGTEHLEHLPEQVVLAGTHHGFGDAPIVRHAIGRFGGRRLRRSRLIIAISAGGFNSGGPNLGGIGVLPWYGMLAFGLFPLRQYTRLEESLRRLARAAGTRNSVLIFPQGTHARPEEERVDSPRVRFHAGVAHLAEAMHAPVVPFGVAGTERPIPSFPEDFKGLKIAGIPISLKRSPMAIAFGAPVTIGPGETPQAFSTRLQRLCYALTCQAEEALAGSEATPAG